MDRAYKEIDLGGGYSQRIYSGYKVWYLNGKLHREDGPAVEYPNGSKMWYLNGIEVTEETIGFIIKRKRKLALNYWLLWTDYVMNPTTERGRRYANRQYDKLEHI